MIAVQGIQNRNHVVTKHKITCKEGTRFDLFLDSSYTALEENSLDDAGNSASCVSRSTASRAHAEILARPVHIRHPSRKASDLFPE